jgi:hypothetical protein
MIFGIEKGLLEWIYFNICENVVLMAQLCWTEVWDCIHLPRFGTVLLLVGSDDYTEPHNERRPAVTADSSILHVEFPAILPGRKLLFFARKYYLGSI